MRSKYLPMVLATAFAASCSRQAANSDAPSIGANQATSSGGTDLSKVEGDWVVVGDTSGRGDTGTLSIRPDGKFDMTYLMGAAGAKKETDSGTYRLSHETIQGQDLLMIDFSSPKLKNKDNPTGMMMRLMYDPTHNILHDLLTVMFARPNEAKKVQAEMEQLRPKK